MTIRDMQYDFQMQLNQFSEALTLTTDDTQYWLNKAQIQLVKNKYSGFNRQGIGFEQSQQRIDDLRTLLVKDSSTPTIHNPLDILEGYHVDKAEIPANNLYLISYRVLVAYNYPEIEYDILASHRTPKGDFKQKITKARFGQADDIYKLLEDPFNKSKPTSPIVDVNDDYINIYTDKTFVAEKAIINYLRMPVTMNIKEGIGSELPEHLHEEIIQQAVDLFLQNTRELKQRLQRETPVSNQEEIEKNNE